MPPPPYQLRDNPNTWLDQADLVFIDPVGTGYSRAKTVEIARRMNGVQGDLQSVGEFIRMYVTRNDRTLSPLFVAGESYGTFRAAGLAGYLIDRGIAFNGVVLISATLNLETIWSRSDDLVYALELPTYAADAWYHKKVPADLQKKDVKTFLKEVEGFAMGEYTMALNKGDALPAAERKATIDKLVTLYGPGGALHRPEQSAVRRFAFHARTAARQARDHRAAGRTADGAFVVELGRDQRVRPFEHADRAAVSGGVHQLRAHRAGVQDGPVLLRQRRHSAVGLRRAERVRRHHGAVAQRVRRRILT